MSGSYKFTSKIPVPDGTATNKSPLKRTPVRRTSKTYKVNSPQSTIDPEWELIHPNPNIFSLFQRFNRKFFWDTLGVVDVRWSRRNTSAGTCTFKGTIGCTISLSFPLLKLRPRKDLIETLLHEMIHAFLFLTQHDSDRNVHGSLFLQHMDRINSIAGTKISVSHTFLDKARHHKTHWWRCNGPCRSRRPFFGIIKKAINRAPGPQDVWYAKHKAICNGSFIKIHDPESWKPRNRDISSMQNMSSSPIKKTIDTGNSSLQSPKKEATQSPNTTNEGTSSVKSPDHFSGTHHELASPGSSKLVSCPACTIIICHNKMNEHLDSCVKMDLVDEGEVEHVQGHYSEFSTCPVCDVKVNIFTISTHVNDCIQTHSYAGPTETNKDNLINTPSTSGISSTPINPPEELFANCPVCEVSVLKDEMNEHLDSCACLDLIVDSYITIEEPKDDIGNEGIYHCPSCDLICVPDDIHSHRNLCPQILYFY